MKAFAKSITQESSSSQQTMKALEIRRWMIHVYSDYGLSKQRFRHLQDAVTPAASNTGISTNLAASCAWYKKRLPQLLIITHPSSLLLPQPLSTPIYLHLQRPWSLTRTPPAEKQKKLILLLHRRTRKKRIRKTRERKTRKQNKQTKAQARTHTHFLLSLRPLTYNQRLASWLLRQRRTHLPCQEEASRQLNFQAPMRPLRLLFPCNPRY